MALQVRPIRAHELPRAQELSASDGRGIHDPEVLTELPRLWHELLHERRLEMHVFVDDTLAPPQRIQGVASGALVSDAFADTLLAERTPMLARQVMRAEMHGPGVILSRVQAAQANAGAGVNAVELDFAFACSDWLAPAARRWVPPMLASLRLWLDGWRLRMALRECIGDDLYQLVRATGCLLQSHPRLDGQRHHEQRYLMGMTREQSRALPQAMASMLFFDERLPRFQFTMAQQDLLLLALDNQADGDCAAQLHVSPHTVKLRWRAIFERVAEERPDWFPAAEPDHGHRGVEKRRHLLAYLAGHMEELRPRARARSGHPPPG